MKRPHQHVSGDIGLKSAARAFARIGWACDLVQSDYGEDLILQTTLHGVVDPFRTLVQVRSSNRFEKDKCRPSSRISRKHALRWIRSAEPVLFVLWDIQNDRGWYNLPSDQFDEYDLLLSTKQSFLLKFDVDTLLTSQAMDRLGWRLRLQYFRKRILLAEESDTINELYDNRNSHTRGLHRSNLSAVVFEFFRAVGVITKRGLSTDVRQMFSNAKRNIRKYDYPPEPTLTSQEKIEYQALLLVLIGVVNQNTGVGLPLGVARAVAPFLLALLKHDRQG